MNDDLSALRHVTRRHFFGRCGIGLGSVALASLLSERRGFSNEESPDKAPHFAPRAKNVIYLFMAGGPSQLDQFDFKPKLIDYNGQPIPESFIAGKRFAIKGTSAGTKLLGSRRAFKRCGQSGAWVSEVFPHTAGIVDDISFLHACKADLFNHAPAILYMNTGSGQFGRPSMGAWLTYGIGSEAANLPGFVVLLSGPRGPRGGAVNWGSGFLPTSYQGVPFRGGGDPILDLSMPKGITAEKQRRTLDVIRDLNLSRMVETGDPEISTRIAACEMAYRMQTSAPEVIDLSGESEATLRLYGVEKNKPSFARNCLLARRLVERGVRFVQLYHTNWDSHGGPGENLQGDFEKVCRDVDQAQAALIKDLKSRGLLDDTLVVWGGEFGRTPMGENRDTTGRNHHIDAFTMWMAGGGVKPGLSIGQTDEFGFNAVEDQVHIPDVHATMLHLLGLDHKQLTFHFQGRDFRLTDVAGEVVTKLLA
jgi:hypothetical protein